MKNCVFDRKEGALSHVHSIDSPHCKRNRERRTYLAETPHNFCEHKMMKAHSFRITCALLVAILVVKESFAFTCRNGGVLFSSKLFSSSSSSSSGETTDYTDKTLYQRVFYRFSPGSDVDVHDSVVLEERVRFEKAPSDDDDDDNDDSNNQMLQAVGPRTLILRDGQVDDGEIGDDFFTLTLQQHSGAASTHTGAGTDRQLESDVCAALYLASNPDLCRGRMLQVSCRSGIASLLGSIGAAYVSKKQVGNSTTTAKRDVADEILTIGGKRRRQKWERQ